MKSCESSNFLLLLASPESLSYRGLYSFEPHTGTCLRLHGTGPTTLTAAVVAAMENGGNTKDKKDNTNLNSPTEPNSSTTSWIVDNCFKYVTSSRSFALIPSKEVTLTTDAITIRVRYTTSTNTSNNNNRSVSRGKNSQGAIAGGMNA